MANPLQSFANVRREEVPSVVAAGLFFFCVLTALMVIRPARDALGMQAGIEQVRWLFQGTLVVTLLVNPVFGFLVGRFRRMAFISATYLFFAASLLVFQSILVMAPQAIGVRTGQVFYVWFSVFNLFSTALFWALMADRFTLEQSKRFFAVIAVGGTLGAIFGPWLAGVLVESIGTPSLLLVSAGFLVLALGFAATVARLQPAPAMALGAPVVPVGESTDAGRGAPIGGSAWGGFRAVVRSRYLLGISAFALIVAVMATFLYFTQLQMVADLGEDVDAQTAMFANINFFTQVATLATQLLLTGHLMKRIGVPFTLALLPITTVLGFVGLAVLGIFRSSRHLSGRVQRGAARDHEARTGDAVHHREPRGEVQIEGLHRYRRLPGGGLRDRVAGGRGQSARWPHRARVGRGPACYRVAGTRVLART